MTEAIGAINNYKRSLLCFQITSSVPSFCAFLAILGLQGE